MNIKELGTKIAEVTERGLMTGAVALGAKGDLAEFVQRQLDASVGQSHTFEVGARFDAENYDKVRPECVIPPSSGMTFISRELSTNGIHPKTESGQIIGLHEGDAKVTLIVIINYRFGCDTDGYDEQNEIGQVTLTTSEEEKVLKTNNDIEDQTFPKSDSINVGKDGVINILAEALEYSQVIKVVVEQAVEATETLEATSTPTSPATKTPIDPSETPDPTPTEPRILPKHQNRAKQLRLYRKTRPTPRLP